MYTFNDKGGRSLTLRPEGTSGAMRAVIEHGLLGGALPLKVSYLTSCFRYEKPQAGRLREFHQFGAECIGTESAAADAEMIALASQVFDELGAKGIRLEINSIGCPKCRKTYHEALKAILPREKIISARLASAASSATRCGFSTANARNARRPRKALRRFWNFSATTARRILRISRPGFPPWISPTPSTRRSSAALITIQERFLNLSRPSIGAQGTVCGGGRYDGLVEMLGGSSAPGIGFGMGIERLLLVMEASEAEFPPTAPIDIYIGSIGQTAGIEAAKLCAGLRAEGFYAACDLNNRSVKAQMKYADKIGAAFSCIIGDDELAAGEASVKNMKDGTEEKVKFDSFTDHLYNTRIDSLCEALEDI